MIVPPDAADTFRLLSGQHLQSQALNTFRARRSITNTSVSRRSMTYVPGCATAHACGGRRLQISTSPSM